MKIFSGISENSNSSKDGIVSIGVFDSIHKGHQILLKDLAKTGDKLNLESFVLTFRIPPKKDNALKTLELDDRLHLIEEIGINNVILCDFDDNFSTIKPFDFARILEKNYNIKNYFIGKDFRFGHNKTGSIDELKQLGYKVFIEETFEIDSRKVSTSEIKKYISDGSIELANTLLGRPYHIKGTVRMGKQLGRILGYPTMNITNSEVMYPSNGAYMTTTVINNIEYKSMTFVDSSIIETHVIGYDEYDYNFMIQINFLKKIRDNVFFGNVDLLKKQLEIDLKETKLFFNIQ